jgi:hypothetical protein
MLGSIDTLKTKPDADFVVRLVGPGVKPWAVPTRTLSRILDAVQRMVEQTEDEDEGEGERTSGGDAHTLRLIEIRSTSAAYAVAATDHDSAISVLTATGKGIDAPDKFEWQGPTISSIEKLSEAARSLNCTIEIRLPHDGRRYGDVIARIGPDTFGVIANVAYVVGKASVFGKIERVGGATKMHCGLRLPEQSHKMVICRVVSADLIRQLGQHIYKTVMVTGEATWIRRNWEVKHFVINGFEAPKTGSIRESLDEVYRAGGSAWDSVKNPNKVLAEMRGR